MVIRVEDAMKEALRKIEVLGYIVRSAQDGENIEIYWPRNEEPPEISPWLEIIQADPSALEKVLEDRSVNVPLWILFGYPWDRSSDEWQQLQKSLTGKKDPLSKKKRSYASACLKFLNKENKQTWAGITWEEPWPISA